MNKFISKVKEQWVTSCVECINYLKFELINDQQQGGSKMFYLKEMFHNYLGKMFHKYLVLEINDYLPSYPFESSTCIYRFENGYGIAIHSLVGKNDEGWLLMKFSFKLLNPNGSELKTISSKEMNDKLNIRYSTFYFHDNTRLMEAVNNLVKEAQEYLMTCNENIAV